MKGGRFLRAVLVMTLVTPLLAQAEDARVRALIARLSQDDLETREAAAIELARIGAPAEALKKVR